MSVRQEWHPGRWGIREPYWMQGHPGSMRNKWGERLKENKNNVGTKGTSSPPTGSKGV